MPPYYPLCSKYPSKINSTSRKVLLFRNSVATNRRNIDGLQQNIQCVSVNVRTWFVSNAGYESVCIYGSANLYQVQENLKWKFRFYSCSFFLSFFLSIFLSFFLPLFLPFFLSSMNLAKNYSVYANITGLWKVNIAVHFARVRRWQTPTGDY